MKLILASGSPRRRQLLGFLGVPFEVIVSHVDESVVTVIDPAINARETARLKTDAVAEMLRPTTIDPTLIIGSDTNVAIGSRILGKPRDAQEAFEMLALLRGQVHQVHTGVVLHRLDRAEDEAFTITGNVYMRSYTDDEIRAYIATGDPMDKAGAYAIQHPVFQPVERYEGCYASVMGLPLCELIRRLPQVGLPLGAVIAPDCPQHHCYRQSEFDPLFANRNKKG